MADPISITLAAAAFVEPAIRTAYKAYGLHQLNRSFGKDYSEYCRKLDGQKARMEEWSQWPIGSLQNSQNDNLAQVVIAELAATEVNLKECAALRSKYEIHTQISKEAITDNSGLSSANYGRNQLVTPALSAKSKTQRSESSTSLNSQSDVSNETAITSIHDSFIDPKTGRPHSDEYLHKVANQQHRDAVHMQGNTSFIKRLRWMVKDREEYKACVRKVTESNDLIEGLVRVRALNLLNSKGVRNADGETKSAVAVEIGQVNSTQMMLRTLPAEDQSSIDTLARLHGALVQSKVDDLTIKFQFGLKISLEHSLTRESLLEQFEKLPFRAHSQVYMLQALKPLCTDESSLLIAESPVEAYPAQSTPQLLEEDLDPFVHIGDFSTVPSDIHRLYRDSTSWAPVMSLQDLIGSTEKPPSPTIRFRLAAMLAATHLHFSGLTYLPGQLNPESFKYFDFSSEAKLIERQELLEDEDRLLNLYYFSGIGSARPKNSTRGIGALRGTKPTFDVATTDLGLLLYQIGSWKLLKCSKASSTAIRENLREVVKGRVHELNRNAGLRYAETVEKCLEWRHLPPKARQSELPRLYHEIVKSLKDLDEEVRFGRVGVLSTV